MITYMEPTLYTDPCAPWNWPDEKEEEEQWEEVFFAENIHTGDIIEVKEQTYRMLPDTYEEAVRRRSNWAQNDIQRRICEPSECWY